ncbi:hypothetical protein [Dyadobacter jiangsuensis]|uniref:DKNYY family protein n=1 Tax=Dyadobacter jiangsuensis TaxID=1591085 RepID=A0A2P8GC44_9BACT|nr:hypothetical protein [Dyadobacter jiangsuensis]PSL31517.1 hypothetical protein CLV60_103383 [Dyadobacter jiangsuensis]
MKKLFCFIIVAMVAALIAVSCKKKEAPAIEVSARLNRDSVNLGVLYVDQAYRHIGKDSANLFEIDTIYKIYQKRVFLAFPYKGEGSIMLYFGDEFLNTEIEGPARTFALFNRVSYPSGLACAWDEEKGTLVVTSKYTPDLLKMVFPGKSAYIDPASSRIHHSLASARAVNKAGGQSFITFIYHDDDPKLGQVTYKLRLKQLFVYVPQAGFQGYDSWYAMY